MDYKKTRSYLLSRPEAREDFPFGPEVAVMKISDKMLATLSQSDGTARMNLKCEPEQALMLRDIFPAVLPGYHMNKTHWNTVELQADVPGELLRQLVDHSYERVVAGLSKRLRDELAL